MPYVTVPATPSRRFDSIDRYLFGDDDIFAAPVVVHPKTLLSCTRTVYVERLGASMLRRYSIPRMIESLERFNSQFAPLFSVDRQSLYRSYKIPKKSGNGERPIDEPNPDLMVALRTLKTIFENEFHALHHTCAYAYVSGRCTVDALARHQANESRWFLKTDFENFFPSTTLDFVMEQFSKIFPFSEIICRERGEYALRRALSLCFLNGGLPQGSPISPLITNLMMVPFDHIVSNQLRNYDKRYFVYTRYADDIHISCRVDFNYRKVEAYINETLGSLNAPFRIKAEKTHYGSSAGRNWMLGLMLNKDNAISLGHQRKKELRAWLSNYLTDRSHQIPTSAGELQKLRGNMSYCKMVEPQWYKGLIDHYNKKFKVDVESCIGSDLAS